MIIIIEGPDGSGKTTLANQLSKQSSYPIIHRVQPKTEHDKKVMLEEYLEVIRTRRNMIFDRSWYSEMVYGPVMRDSSVISHHQMYAIESRLAKIGAMIIYCTNSPEMLWSKCQSRGEQYITSKEDFLKICRGFDELFDIPHYIPVVAYAYADI